MTATGPHVMTRSSATDLESGPGTQAPPRAAETLNETPSSACCCIPSGVFRPSTSMRGGSNTTHSQRNVSDQSIQTGQGSSQAEAQIQPPEDPEDPRMIGDFDGSANEFWKLYRDEAKSHDDARVDTLKDGMESALIFAGLFSAVLTAFVVDSKQKLKPSPADETVYYLRQHSAILSQISVQLSSIAPQVAIPSTPPPPFPPFSPLASDVRINVFWFMALAFSLLAALLAILVQQWVRNYMHVFHRYSDPLKSSRLRKYLYDGCKKWHMRRVAEVVPGFLHISLFLFFAGLSNSLLNIDTKVALSTIVPIGVIGLLYIFMTFVPTIFPQTPYQNSFSSTFWYLFQNLPCRRRFKVRGSHEEMKIVSADMAKGQMELAMEKKVARKGRDVESIRWLIENLTEDAEMEKLLSALPGSFNTIWGTEIWREVGEHQENEDPSQDEPVTGPMAQRDTSDHQPPSSSRIRSVLGPIIHLVRTRRPIPRHSPTHAIEGENVVHELSKRVARSVEIYKTPKRFVKLEDEDLWRKHGRACIETTALLHFCANAKLAWFGDITGLLGNIGSFDKIRDRSLAGTDELFVIRWTCLSLVAIRPILADRLDNVKRAKWALEGFEGEDDTNNKDALAGAQKIDKTLQNASGCLFRLYDALQNTKDLTEVKKILGGHDSESQILELEQIKFKATDLEKNHFKWADVWIFSIQNAINYDSHQIISQIPGVLDDQYGLDWALVPFNLLVEPSHDPRKMQFIAPAQTLGSFCSPATTLRNIHEGREDAVAYKELLKNIEKLRSSFHWRGVMERQVWRLQDLRNGGGFGFIVELFFLAFSQLLSTSSSKESHSVLYTDTFRAITSDWSKHRHSLGTQIHILNIALSHRSEFEAHPSICYYPDYIVNEFLSLLGKIFEGQELEDPHIDEARQRFASSTPFEPRTSRRFGEKVLSILTRGQPQPQAS